MYIRTMEADKASSGSRTCRLRKVCKSAGRFYPLSAENHFPEKNLILQKKSMIRSVVTAVVTFIRARVSAHAVAISRTNKTACCFVYIKEKICGAENEKVLIKIPFQPVAFRSDVFSRVGMCSRRGKVAV